MRKKYFYILSPVVAFVIYMSMNSFSTGISGVSSASMGGCSCHDPSPNPNTIITLAGLPPVGYVNGATYTITLTASNLSVTGVNPRNGFDLTASDGVFTAVTGTQLSGDSEILHDIPKVVVAGVTSWTFTWTAPLTGNATIVFNAACNTTNGDETAGPGDAWNFYSTSSVNAANPATTLNLNLFIEGYYSGSSFMSPVLFNQGAGLSFTETDTITVALKDPITFATAAVTQAVLNTDGTVSCNFTSVSGPYYIAVSHRHGLVTWSALPVVIGTGINSYNFTTAANKAYGDNMKELEPGIWGFYAGEVNSDENIDLLDLNAVETDINNFEFGYFATDVNGDGNVDLLDTPALEINVSNFIFSIHP